MAKITLVPGIGIRGVGAAPRTSVAKVLKVLKSTKCQIKPKQTRRDRLEAEEFWTYAENNLQGVFFRYRKC
jgi:hypothetical protein